MELLQKKLSKNKRQDLMFKTFHSKRNKSKFSKIKRILPTFRIVIHSLKQVPPTIKPMSNFWNPYTDTGHWIFYNFMHHAILGSSKRSVQRVRTHSSRTCFHQKQNRCCETNNKQITHAEPTTTKKLQNEFGLEKNF